VTNVGGLPEVVVAGQTGIVVPPKDEGAAAQALEKLFLAPGLRKKMAREGQEWVQKNHGWDENARVMEDLYDRVISGASAGVRAPLDEKLVSASI
jgi:glycosyltransferase involved in cell wall biosynthesis